MSKQPRRAGSFVEALEWAIAGDRTVLGEVATRVAVRPLTDEQRKLLAKLLCSLQTRPKRRPRLEAIDPAKASEQERVLMAQHRAAHAILWRKDNERARVSAIIDEEIDKAATKFRVLPTQLSEKAVRTIVKNKRPRTFRRRLPSFHVWID